jgi:hypothetical protein
MSGRRIGRAALRQLDAEGIDKEVIDLPDQRARELRELMEPESDEGVLATVREVFSGTDVPEDGAKLRYVLGLRAGVRRDWETAGSAFLRIGRTLNDAEIRLSKREFDALINGADRLLPFGRSVAVQLRKVAQAVDVARIPEDRCPASYSVAYQLTTLPDNELRLAEERGLVRVDVTRREVIDFKRAIACGSAPPPNRLALAQARRELQTLAKRRRAMLEEMIAIRRRMRDLAELVGEA